MVYKWKRDQIEKLITSIQQNACIYNVKTPEYLDRMKKAQSYNCILNELQKMESFITLDEIKRKWKNLRTQYMQELRDMNLSIKSGVTTADIYEPKLWCFQQLDFLKEFSNTRTNNVNTEELEPPKPKRIKITSTTDELVQLATQRLKDSQNNNNQIAMVWGNKLSKMEKNQRIIAEKVINEVMFNGELGLLNFDTTLANIGRVCNFNTSLTTTNGNNDLNHTRDSSIESLPDNNYVIRYATSPIPTDIVAVTNAESMTVQENQQECIIADNDPLQNSIKIENSY